MLKEPHFIVLYVSREDLDFIGYDALKVTDEMMLQIIEDMQEEFYEYSFWDALDRIAQALGIPKNTEC